MLGHSAVQGKKSKFSQIFVYDKESQEKELDDRIDHLRPSERKIAKRDTLEVIQTELKKTSPYVKEFKAAARIFQDNPDKELKMVIKAKGSVAAKKRKQNPNVEDIIVVAPGEMLFYTDHRQSIRQKMTPFISTKITICMILLPTLWYFPMEMMDTV